MSNIASAVDVSSESSDEEQQFIASAEGRRRGGSGEANAVSRCNWRTALFLALTLVLGIAIGRYSSWMPMQRWTAASVDSDPASFAVAAAAADADAD